MGKIDPLLLLSWSSILSVWGVVAIIAMAKIILIIIIKPRVFWPLLIIAGIVGCGPRIGGYLLLDEIITSSVIMGALLKILLSSSAKNKIKFRVALSLHKTVYCLWIGFMIFSSIVGVVYNEDLRIVRWIIFYIMLGLIFLISNYEGQDFSFPSPRDISLIVATATLILFLIYLGQGLYFETLFGQHGRFLSQDMFWSGSAYAVFPTIIGAPAALYLINDNSRKVRILAWLLLITIMAVAFYYDSRITWLALLLIVAINMRQLKMGKIVTFLFLFVLGFTLYMPEPMKNIIEFFGMLYDSSKILWSPGDSDINRNLQLQAGFHRLFDNWITFLIGDGIYSHRFTLIPHIEELYSTHLPNNIGLNNIPGSRDDSIGRLTIFRTVGFTALLVDTGMIGMLLFITIFVCVVIKTLKNKSFNQMTLVIVVFLSFAWLLFVNINDVTLLYLILMPGGLIEKWRYNNINEHKFNPGYKTFERS